MQETFIRAEDMFPTLPHAIPSRYHVPTLPHDAGGYLLKNVFCASIETYQQLYLKSFAILGTISTHPIPLNSKGMRAYLLLLTVILQTKKNPIPKHTYINSTVFPVHVSGFLCSDNINISTGNMYRAQGFNVPFKATL